MATEKEMLEAQGYITGMNAMRLLGYKNKNTVGQLERRFKLRPVVMRNGHRMYLTADVLRIKAKLDRKRKPQQLPLAAAPAHKMSAEMAEHVRKYHSA